MNPDACPECNGQARAMHANNVSLVSVANRTAKQERFRTVLDPEYSGWKGGSGIWSREFYVCAGCMGSGKRADWTARILSGEFKA